MPRVTDAEVKAIIDTQRDCTPFIEHADLIVEEDLVGLGHSDARLRQIELYLAAHFAALTEERGSLSVSKTGDSLETYKGEYGSGLNLTRYGQQAQVLETTGKLSNIASATKKAEFRVV